VTGTGVGEGEEERERVAEGEKDGEGEEWGEEMADGLSTGAGDDRGKGISVPRISPSSPAKSSPVRTRETPTITKLGKLFIITFEDVISIQ
jgi:hypothetical protein